VSSTHSTTTFGLRSAGVMLIVALGLGVTACSSSSKTTTAPLPTVSSPGPTITATKQVGNPAPQAAINAIQTYETKHGPALGTWLLTYVQDSKVDNKFVLYKIGPAAPKDTNVQAGYGFVHELGTTWGVVGFGTDQVGCPPGVPGNATIPPTVLSSFGLSCSD
jgi:hypothetical protein